MAYASGPFLFPHVHPLTTIIQRHLLCSLSPTRFVWVCSQWGNRVNWQGKPPTIWMNPMSCSPTKRFCYCFSLSIRCSQLGIPRSSSTQWGGCWKRSNGMIDLDERDFDKSKEKFLSATKVSPLLKVLEPTIGARERTDHWQLSIPSIGSSFSPN